jgi:hypothetical protein
LKESKLEEQQHPNKAQLLVSLLVWEACSALESNCAIDNFNVILHFFLVHLGFNCL